MKRRNVSMPVALWQAIDGKSKSLAVSRDAFIRDALQHARSLGLQTTPLPRGRHATGNKIRRVRMDYAEPAAFVRAACEAYLLHVSHATGCAQPRRRNDVPISAYVQHRTVRAVSERPSMLIPFVRCFVGAHVTNLLIADDSFEPSAWLKRQVGAACKVYKESEAWSV